MAEELKKTEEKKEEQKYICPLTVNYKELEVLLKGKSIADYVGDNLPEDEITRIQEDYDIYKLNQKNK